MFRLCFLVCALTAAQVAAQGISVAVLDAAGVPDSAPRRLQKATELALRQVSSLPVTEGPAWKKGAPRKCAADDCARELVTSLGTSAVVLLDLKPGEGKGERASVDVQLWVDGAKAGSKRGEGTLDGFEGGIRGVVEALLPTWARKGFGALQVEVEPGSVIKVDGRLSTAKPGALVSVPAGPHQLDVVFPEGHALLQRVEVAEGARLRLTVDAPTQVVNTRGPQGTSVLRGVSYGIFVAGSAALAGGLVAGALGKDTARGLASCQGNSRDCASLEEVLQKQTQAQAYASTGNVLIGVGTGLALTGVTLFIIDALTH